MTKLAVTSAFAASAGRAGTVDELGVADIGLGVWDVKEKSFTEGEDDLVRMHMAEAMAVIVMIYGCPRSLAFGENERGAVDVSDVGRCVEVTEMVKESGNWEREGALRVGRENEGWTVRFVEIVVAIRRGVAGDTITRTED